MVEVSNVPNLDKAELEVRKLALEVSQLSAPWWRRPSFLLAALPTVLAMLTVVYGFANGYFQAVATKLENQRHDLEAEVKLFESKKHELQTDIGKLKATLDEFGQSLASCSKGVAYNSYLHKKTQDRVAELESILRKHNVEFPPAKP